jgi:hypothetical protein
MKLNILLFLKRKYEGLGNSKPGSEFNIKLDSVRYYNFDGKICVDLY